MQEQETEVWQKCLSQGVASVDSLVRYNNVNVYDVSGAGGKRWRVLCESALCFYRRQFARALFATAYVELMCMVMLQAMLGTGGVLLASDAASVEFLFHMWESDIRPVLEVPELLLLQQGTLEVLWEVVLLQICFRRGT